MFKVSLKDPENNNFSKMRRITSNVLVKNKEQRLLKIKSERKRGELTKTLKSLQILNEGFPKLHRTCYTIK